MWYPTGNVALTLEHAETEKPKIAIPANYLSTTISASVEMNRPFVPFM